MRSLHQLWMGNTQHPVARHSILSNNITVAIIFWNALHESKPQCSPRVWTSTSGDPDLLQLAGRGQRKTGKLLRSLKKKSKRQDWGCQPVVLEELLCPKWNTEGLLVVSFTDSTDSSGDAAPTCRDTPCPTPKKPLRGQADTFSSIRGRQNRRTKGTKAFYGY